MGMHIYFSGIGGTGIGPLALIAHQAGYEVSGSDKQSSQYTAYLQQKGIRLHIGQSEQQIAAEHRDNPIDWIVYSSALPLEDPHHPELLFAQKNTIRATKRDAFLNQLITDKHLSMLAVAGTHGKTTTTAMLAWVCKSLLLPLSYSVGAKIDFGDMGYFDEASKYFAYECDEFDKNFLQFSPAVSLITSIDWDHQEIYPNRDDYKDAFREFISQSKMTFMHQKDANYLGIETTPSVTIIDDTDPILQKITLPGAHNRQNGLLIVKAISAFFEKPVDTIITALNMFPGSSRRFEKIATNLYSDYAHTPEEVAATLQLASELSKNIVVVYEPLTDRRQHFMKDAYKTVFEPAKQIYWLPSYLAREDTSQTILTPEVLIAGLNNAAHAQVASKNDDLKRQIDAHLKNGDLVLCMAGGGGGSLDEWIRQQYKNPA